MLIDLKKQLYSKLFWRFIFNGNYWRDKFKFHHTSQILFALHLISSKLQLALFLPDDIFGRSFDLFIEQLTWFPLTLSWGWSISGSSPPVACVTSGHHWPPCCVLTGYQKNLGSRMWSCLHQPLFVDPIMTKMLETIRLSLCNIMQTL